MDTFEAAAKPDRFHQSLSNSWASFLSAHHFGREVAALRKALDEHTQQTRLAIASLEKAAADRHDPLAAAVTESKSTIEQHAAELKELTNLRASLATYQQDASQAGEDASRRITELADMLVAQQGSLERALFLTSRDIAAVQEKHRLALETVDRLRGELSQARAAKIASEEKLAALEERVNSMDQPSPAISEHAAGFLEEMLSRREELIKLLDTPQPPAAAAVTPISAPTSVPSASQVPATSESIPWDHPFIPAPYPTQHQHRAAQPIHSRPPTPPRRKPEEPPQQPPPSPPKLPPGTGQDIRALYQLFRDRYRTSPPPSDTAFIWEFIGCIEPPAMSRHIQESLAAILPEHVVRCRDTRRRDPRRHVTISKGLTWRRFREALVRIPGPG